MLFGVVFMSCMIVWFSLVISYLVTDTLLIFILFFSEQFLKWKTHQHYASYVVWFNFANVNKFLFLCSCMPSFVKIQKGETNEKFTYTYVSPVLGNIFLNLQLSKGSQFIITCNYFNWFKKKCLSFDMLEL